MNVHAAVKVVKKGHKHEGKAGVIQALSADKKTASVKLDVRETVISVPVAALEYLGG